MIQAYSRIFLHSGTFKNIQPCSGILRDIKAYWGIFRRYWGVWSHNQTYSELCVTLACATMPYSEPWLIYNWRHLQKSAKHIRWTAYSVPWHSQNVLFNHFQGYLGIFRDIDAYSVTLIIAQLETKSFLILEKKALIVFLMKCLSKCPSSTKLSSCPEKFLVAHLHSGIILFAKRFILNIWQCFEYICLRNCSVNSVIL